MRRRLVCSGDTEDSWGSAADAVDVSVTDGLGAVTGNGAAQCDDGLGSAVLEETPRFLGTNAILSQPRSSEPSSCSHAWHAHKHVLVEAAPIEREQLRGLIVR